MLKKLQQTAKKQVLRGTVCHLLSGEDIHDKSNNFQCHICSENIQSSKPIRILCKDQISNNDLTSSKTNRL